MSTPFKFTIHDEPVEAELAAVIDGMPSTWLAAGIVNPMGPTLTIMASDEVGSPGDRLNIYQVMLNPFSQSCYEVGTVEVGDKWTPARDLEPLFDLEWGGCPTLLMPSALYDSEGAEQVFSELLRRFDDVSETLAQVQKHPGDPWTRVKGDMDSVLGNLLKQIGGSKPKATGSKEEAAKELARIQLESKNLHEEFKAFMFAWEGSMNFLNMPGLGRDKFVAIFARFAMSARLPFMRNIIDNPELLES
jgi:hypothetical protein